MGNAVETVIGERVRRLRALRLRRVEVRSIPKWLLWMKSFLRIAMVCAALAGIRCSADVLPDKPQPQGHGLRSERLPARGAFAVRNEFWIEAGALGAAWSADTVSTHELLAANPNVYEVGGLFNGSRSTPKVMAAWAGVDLGMGFAAYEWKNHVHNRLLHPFWRAFLAVPIEWHIQAAVHNRRLR